MASRYKFVRAEILSEEQIGSHRQESWELSYVVRGHGTRTIGNNVSPFSEGDLVLVAPHVVHCWRFENENIRICNLSLFISDGYLVDMKLFMPEMSAVIDRIRDIRTFVVFKGEIRDKIAAGLMSMSDMDEVKRSLAVLQILYMIGTETLTAGDIGDVSDPHKNTMDTLQLYLECNFNRNANLSEAANAVGMGRTTLCSFLRRHYDTTFSELLNAVRVRQACEMLRHTPLGIEQIAYACGFNSPSYFNRVFKAQNGFTPGKYRNG
jgi:AraC-like DNA-binding protein